MSTSGSSPGTVLELLGKDPKVSVLLNVPSLRGEKWEMSILYNCEAFFYFNMSKVP